MVLGDDMEGINLNAPISYAHSSLRYFYEGEHHVSRRCNEDVLLLVFEGVLRFSENGAPYELQPCEYFIQKHGTEHTGELPSDSPKYLYVHFCGEWGDGAEFLPRRGRFEYALLKPLLEELDSLAHGKAPYVLQVAKFYEILSALYRPKKEDTAAAAMAEYMKEHYSEKITLETLCDRFHFSKNHVINLFKKEFSLTPVTYINRLRLLNAERRMEVTSDSLESIAFRCGFPNYSHFYKLFLAKNQCSPEQWRKKIRMGLSPQRTPDFN